MEPPITALANGRSFVACTVTSPTNPDPSFESALGQIRSRCGNDRLQSRAGNNNRSGWAGNNTLTGGAGWNVLVEDGDTVFALGSTTVT